MGLSAGTRLGPYEIVSALGAGGMGEVYRSRDTRLGRDVAIKVLSSKLGATPAAKARFEREARTISTLNHPHICTLHDIGSENGTDYLVLELLEGETLADRLKRGPLPLNQLLEVAIQAADALDKAHRAGIVHRDLKPGNIMLTKAGVKVLDFGLAKPAVAGTAGSASASVFTAAPTLTSPASPLTGAGSIVGTVQYMAPEQIEGREADARSDIFSFGLTLYEMATGRPAFSGKTQASVAAGILALDPPSISSLQPSSPAALARLIDGCLEKDPEERYQTVHDLKLQLQAIAEAPATVPVTATVPGSQMPWIVAAIAGFTTLVLVGALWWLWQQPKPVYQAQIVPPEKTTLITMINNSGVPVVSPDGTRLAFVARDENGHVQLYVRALNSLTAQPLTGTENAMHPFWSADSRNLAFLADGHLKRVGANGGPPQALAQAGSGRGGTWNRDDIILYSPGSSGALMRISATGGEPVAATKLLPSEAIHRWPQFLPDGKHFLFWILSAGGNTGIAVGTLGSLDHQLILRNDSAGMYASGFLLFVRDQTLMAQPFNASTLKSTGEAMPLAERVAVNGGLYRPVFSTSDNGVLVYQGGASSFGWRLFWSDRTGKQTPLSPPARYLNPALSPDGKRVAVASGNMSGGNTDIWIFDMARSNSMRLTFDTSNKNFPVWTPDGKRVLYSSDRTGAGTAGIFSKAADGSGTEETVLNDGRYNSPTGFSPDGRYLVLEGTEGSSRTGLDISVVPMFGERKSYFIVQTPLTDVRPSVSPDGRWMAYQSDESGSMEVYLTTFPKGGPKWQVSSGRGGIPHWRGDGKELYFTGLDNRLFAVDVDLRGNSPILGTPRTLFVTSAVAGPFGPYVASADGKHFLINGTESQQASEPLTLITNWPQQLKK